MLSAMPARIASPSSSALPAVGRPACAPTPRIAPPHPKQLDSRRGNRIGFSGRRDCESSTKPGCGRAPPHLEITDRGDKAINPGGLERHEPRIALVDQWYARSRTRQPERSGVEQDQPRHQYSPSPSKTFRSAGRFSSIPRMNSASVPGGSSSGSFLIAASARMAAWERAFRSAGVSGINRPCSSNRRGGNAGDRTELVGQLIGD